MPNFENFDSPKAETKPDINFGITAAENRAVLEALRPNANNLSDTLPPLTLFDQSDNLLAGGDFHLYNGAGGDSLGKNGDTMHLAIDPTAKHKDNPGILQHINLPEEQASAKKQASDPPVPGQHPPDQTTSNQQPADQTTSGQHPSDQTASGQDGQPLHVKFWARSDHSDSLNVDVLQSKSPYAQTLDEHVKLTPQWTEYNFDGVAPTNGTKLDLHFTTPGAVDIGNVSVTPESPEQIGVNPHDLTAAGMNENIDHSRKGELKINVVDKNGKPVSGADVYIEQTKQDFLFGTEVQGLHPDNHSRSQQEYQEALKDTFNFATVTPYWPQTEEKKHPNENNFAHADEQIEWLKENHMDVRVHPAFWPHWTPKSLPTDPDQAVPIIDEHTQEFVQHFSKPSNVRFIENNEVAAAQTDSVNNGATNWVKEVGAPTALEHETAIEQKAILAERQATASPDGHGSSDSLKNPDSSKSPEGLKNPDSSKSSDGLKNPDSSKSPDSLNNPESSKSQDSLDKSRGEIQIDYNDYKNNQQEIQVLDQLQKEGKLPDAIGIQMHMTQGNWPLGRVEQIIDELAKYGKPIYISEISVLSGEHRTGDSKSQKDWKSTKQGEAEQADYVQELYKTLYSNPHVEGITWWDLSDKGAWQNAPRGLLRRDMSEKPAFEDLQNLITHDWETNDHVASNANGDVQQRVFAGDYDITVTDAHGKAVEQNVHIGEGGNTAVTVELDQ